MLITGPFTTKSKPMIRFVSVLAVACTLSGTAQAQMSQADLLTRIERLEAALRDLTGTVEQLQYRNGELEQQVKNLQQGASIPAPQRPTAQAAPPPPPYSPPPQYSPPPPGPYTPPQAQYSPPPSAVIATAPAEPPPEGEASSGRRGDAFNPALNPTAPGAPRPLGTSTNATEPPPPVAEPPAGPRAPRQAGPPLNLGTLSGEQASAAPGGGLPPPPPSNPSATGAVAPTLPPSASPKDEYDLAYGYVLHKDYGQAADTFRDFLHKHPSDRLAGEAQYWLGESLFQKQQYRDAAEAFLAVSTKYETTARAPDALLRLGESLAALGEKEAACASLGEVLRKYPRASLSVKQNVQREQKRVHC